MAGRVLTNAVWAAFSRSTHGKKTAVFFNSWRTCTYQTGGTVDEVEAQKFRDVSWWDPRGPMAALHSMNMLRVPMIKNSLLGLPPDDVTTLDQMPHPLQGCSILDVGCGAGLLCEPLGRLGAEITGIDPSEANIAVARQHAAQDPDVRERVRYECSSVEAFVDSGAQGRQFDAVVASEVVEHVADLRSFVSEQCKLVKPGGWAIFTTINRTFLSQLLAIIAAEDILGLVPKGSHTWEKFVPPAELSQCLSDEGLQVDFCRGMMLNPLSMSWAWIGDTSVNYALRATRTSTEALSLGTGEPPRPEAESLGTEKLE